MATFRQKTLVQKMSGNVGKPMGQIMKEVGYSDSFSQNPKRALESKGVRSELERLGLTPELIVLALVEDINNKPQNRVRELELACKILSMDKREEETSKPVPIIALPYEIIEKKFAR